LSTAANATSRGISSRTADLLLIVGMSIPMTGEALFARVVAT
jgi:hypothetical protein